GPCFSLGKARRCLATKRSRRQLHGSLMTPRSFGADRQAPLLAEPGNVGSARVGLLTTGEVPCGGSPAPERSPVRNSGDAVAPCLRSCLRPSPWYQRSALLFSWRPTVDLIKSQLL